MVTPFLETVLHQAQHSDVSGRDTATDRQLLQRFVDYRDETAFATLVQRHGRLVLGVCRRVLGHSEDAQDVFQATFLVLARKANSLNWHTPAGEGAGLRALHLGNWLYGVAYRLAAEGRRASARRRRHERRAGMMQSQVGPEQGQQELAAVLDEELARLPEKYRAPLLGCYLEGKTRNEVAQQLGCPLGTLKHHLEHGRELLRQRLTRRGFTLSAVLLSAELGSETTRAGMASLVASTTRSALTFVTGSVSAGGVIPGRVLTLVEGALKGALMTRWKVFSVVLAVGLAVVGATGWAYLAAVPSETRPAARKPASNKPGDPRRPEPRKDPLPPRALVRLGPVRLRHGSGIDGMALSPDGKTVATVGDHVLRLWDLASGQGKLTVQKVPVPEGYSAGQNYLAFSPDGKTLAYAGKDKAVHLLDASTCKEKGRFTGHPEVVQTVAFAPDGKTLVSAARGDIRFWDPTTGKERRRLNRAGSLVVFAPDGRTMALYGTTRKSVALFDELTGKQVRTLTWDQEITRVVFSPDGQTLAMIGRDATVQLWDTTTGRPTCTLKHPTPQSLPIPREHYLTALVFSPDGKILATGCNGHSIQLWDPVTGKHIRQLLGHTWWVTGLAFTPDGRTLVSSSWDTSVLRWDVATGKQHHVPGDEIQHSRLARTHDGAVLATAGAEGIIHLSETATGRLLRTLRGHKGGLLALDFSPDGKMLASAGQDYTVHLWDVARGRVIRILNGPPKLDAKGRIDVVAFAPDGRTLAADTEKNVIALWDVASEKEIRKFPHKGPASLAFSPDGKILASGGWDNTIRLWDPATGRSRETILTRTIVDTLAFSPDGRLLASGHHDKTIRLWDWTAGTEVSRLAGHEGVVWAVQFTPDGRWLASGSVDRTVRLWEVATGQESSRLRGHRGWVLSLAFGKDARTLATSSLDKTSMVWDLRPNLPKVRPDLETLWKALAAKDGNAVYRATWALAEHPQCSAFLSKHLRPARSTIDRKRVEKLLKDLNSTQFATREAAHKELTKCGSAIRSLLEQTIRKSKSPEVRRRCEELLSRMKREEMSPERLRQARSIQVLELNARAQAIRLLRGLAKGAPEASLTQQARQALVRLGQLEATASER